MNTSNILGSLVAVEAGGVGSFWTEGTSDFSTAALGVGSGYSICAGRCSLPVTTLSGPKPLTKNIQNLTQNKRFCIQICFFVVFKGEYVYSREVLCAVLHGAPRVHSRPYPSSRRNFLSKHFFGIFNFRKLEMPKKCLFAKVLERYKTFISFVFLMFF